MKRNQRLFSLLLILTLALALAGCGSSKSASYAPAAAFDSYNGSYYAAEEPMEEMEMGAAQTTASSAGSGLGSKNAMDSDARPMSEKVIYNGRVNLETTEFDAAVDRIAALIAQYDGYLESSSVSGSNYRSIQRGDTGARSASYTIRVPSEHFSAIMGTLPEIGNVPYSETSSRNVTREYYDIQSRLDAFKTQEARLLEMLSVAETVQDMLDIQQQLTEVQYEIDSLTGTLRYYDNQVGYSTIYLNVQEVREYTPEPTITLTYRERMEKGFQESLVATGEFFKELFLWLVTSLPWLLPLILVIVLVLALLKRLFSRGDERKARRAAKRAEKRARKQARADEKARIRQEKRDRKKKPEAPAQTSPAASADAEPVPPAEEAACEEKDESGE